MEFRAEHYEQIVAHLRSEHVDARSRERRASPRAGLRFQVQLIVCRPDSGAKVQPAGLRDISRDGIGFVFHESIEPGTFVVLTLPGPLSRTLDVLFLVVRCQPLSNGQFSVGARFQRVIKPEDV